MKIIKAGNINAVEAVKRFTCPKCVCIFEAGRTEYTVKRYDNKFYYFIDCPFCKNKVVNCEIEH